MTRLREQVLVLLADAETAAAGTPAGAEVAALRARFDEPLRVAVAGRVKAGKSTLLNALLGERLAPTDASECTRIPTWYREGVGYRTSLDLGGRVEQVPFTRAGGVVEVDLGGRAAEEVRRILVDWPSSRLRTMTLVDTPGVGSLTADAERRAALALGAGEEHAHTADAVIYLLRHRHPSDARFLEAFRDESATGTPVNAIGVLSRADEVGGCRADALQVAGRVAARYEADPVVRGVCGRVVPVAGLLAEAAATLTEAEFRNLEAFAHGDRTTVDDLLLAADHVRRDAAVAVSGDERGRLLDRLGIFGLRYGVEAVRSGRVGTARELADELRAASGLDALRALVEQQFLPRAELLKARAALLGLSRVLRERPFPDGDRLLAAVEAIEVGAHELVELRLLNALVAGALDVKDPEAEELRRLLGSGSLAARLGVVEGVAPIELRAHIVAGADRWRRASEHPLASPARSHAARAVARTYEGLLSDLERASG
ncbi:MAG: dynamin family protein [Acidimicrobiales bacterium]|nr:dynamin family protein [Acidimicrobiales bacterium]